MANILSNVPDTQTETIIYSCLAKIDSRIRELNEMAQRIERATCRLVNPRPTPVPPDSVNLPTQPNTVEARLQSMERGLVSLQERLSESADTLDKAI